MEQNSSLDFPQPAPRERLMRSEDLTLEELQNLDLSDAEVAGEFLRRYSGGRRAPGDKDQRVLQAPGHIANVANNPAFDQNHAADLDD